jgi:hypothetical protein
MQMLLAEAERARGRGEVARALLEKVEYARLPRANRLVFHTISARVFLDARQVEPASAAIEQALAALTPQAAPEDRGELYAARSHLHELRHEVDAARALLVLARSELYRAHHLRAVAAVDARLAGLGHR